MSNKKQKHNFSKLPVIKPDGSGPENEKEEKELRQLRKYEFVNNKDPNSWIKFVYGSTKYNETFTFLHGGTYELPRHVALWVQSRGAPIYNWKPDGSGAMDKAQTGMDYRFQMREVG